MIIAVFFVAAATANSVVAFQIFKYLTLSFDVTWRILFILFEHFFQTHFLLNHYLLRNHRVCLELGQHKCQTIWTHIFLAGGESQNYFCILSIERQIQNSLALRAFINEIEHAFSRTYLFYSVSQRDLRVNGQLLHPDALTHFTVDDGRT